MLVGYGVRLGLFLAICVLTTRASHSATIEISPLDSAEQAVVSVSGPFEAADIEQFRTKNLGSLESDCHICKRRRKRCSGH